MSRARDTADGIARAITNGIVVNADINASAAIAQSKIANLSTTLGGKVDYAMTTNTQAGTGSSAYTFVLSDANRLTTSTGATAKTFTIPPQSSVTWVNNSIIRVVNYGAGTLTIAGGVGVTVTNATKTLAQFESAALIRTGSDAWTLVPFSGGISDADFSNAPTGTYTDSGINYKFIQFTSSGTLTVTKSGLADLFMVGAGASGFTNGVDRSSGGGAGFVFLSTIFLPAGTYNASPATSYNGTTTFAGTYGFQAPGGPVVSGTGGGGSSANGFSGGGGLIGGGGGSTGNASGTTGGPGYTSTITGTSVVYAQGGNNAGARSGFGTGRDSGNNGGGLGVVIIRVRV